VSKSVTVGIIPAAIILDLSCSAKAEHPVTTASAVLAQSDTASCLATGSSAFADEDREMSRRLERFPVKLIRHCERSEAIQAGSRGDQAVLDCFVAPLLAMTALIRSDRNPR